MARRRKVKRKKKIERPKITLPTELSEPPEEMGEYSMLLYGEKKIGKTTLAAQFPDACFLMFEPGGKALRIYQRDVASWLDFEKLLEDLKEDERFQTVVIDTADLAYDLCMDRCCKEMGIVHPSEENDFGRSWAVVKKRFAAGVNGLLQLGKGVIFISHAKEEERKTEGGRKFKALTSSMAGQAHQVLDPVVDNWFYYGYSRDQRVLVMKGSERISAGTRLKENFLYTDGTAIKRLNVEGSEEFAYERLMAAYDNELERKKKKGK